MMSVLSSALVWKLLLVFVVSTSLKFVQSKPQVSDDWFNKPVDMDSDGKKVERFSASFDQNQWFKTTEDDHRRLSNNFDTEFNANVKKTQSIFWIIFGVVTFIIISSCIGCACCFFVPACCLAKSMASRRDNRGRTIQGPTVYATNANGVPNYPTQTPAPPGTYPMHATTTTASGYPYGPPQQYHMGQPQPLAAGNLGQGSPYPPALTTGNPGQGSPYRPSNAPGINDMSGSGQPAYNPYQIADETTNGTAGYQDKPPAYPRL